MEFRVDELAAAGEVSVDTVRYYQSLGLLPSPERRGRNAVYDEEHLDRLTHIRELQSRGLSLKVIAKVLDGEMDPIDLGLAEAVATAMRGGDEPLLTLDRLAELSGVPASLLAAVENSGLLIGREVEGEPRYTAADVDLVRNGLKLLEAGLPLADLLNLATRYDEAARTIADEAIALFDEHIREPIIGRASSPEGAAAELVDAFAILLPAVTGLVAHHFRRVILGLAQDRFVEEPADA
ncbi:MAG: MerR family transcriptional regulator [Actinomycetota bacterium]